MSEYKVLIIGDYGVGKTSLVRRFVDGVFIETPDDFYDAKAIVDLDGQRVDLEITDPACRPFTCLCSKHYRHKDAVIIVYDLTNRDSLDRAIGFVKEGGVYGNSGCVFFLVATKADLKEAREIVAAETRDVWERLELLRDPKMGARFECSALTGENVDALFKAVARECESRRHEENDQASWQRAPDPTHRTKTKKGGCSLI